MFHQSYVVDGKNSDESGFAEHETQAKPRISAITGLVCSGSGFYQRMSLYFFIMSSLKTSWNSRCLIIKIVLEI